MSYLIRTKKRVNTDPLTRYVGVHIPLRISSCLTIFSMAHNISKSNFMESVFNYWMDHNYSPEIEENYCIDIAKAMYSKFLDLQTTRRSLSYPMFADDIKRELEYKGLTIPNIRMILKHLDAEHDKVTKLKK
jgi:hypothetical protein